jgi:hypothetical protein
MSDMVDLFGQPDHISKPIQQLPLPLGWRSRRNQPCLLVGAANRDVIGTLDAHVAWPTPIAVLYGPAHSGKSLLGDYLQTLCPTATVIDPAADVEEATLFHACNRALETRLPLLLIWEGPMGSWWPTLPDLASRISGAQQFAIGDPDVNLFAALLIDRLGNVDVPMSNDVAGFIAERVERTYAELDAIAALLRDAVHEHGARLGTPTVRRMLIENGHFTVTNHDSAAA